MLQSVTNQLDTLQLDCTSSRRGDNRRIVGRYSFTRCFSLKLRSIHFSTVSFCLPPQDERHDDENYSETAKDDPDNHNQIEITPRLIQFGLDLVAVLDKMDLQLEE